MNLTNKVLLHILVDNLNHGIKKGSLYVTTPDKQKFSFIGAEKGVSVEWHIHDWNVIKAVSSRGDIGLGETYSLGLWDTSNLEDLFSIFIENINNLERYANGSTFSKFWFWILNHIVRRNSIKGSIANISAHYDVGNEFYKLWLDKTMTYSSALYIDENISLENAQSQKYLRILNKIDQARKNILEIGCGWGGFAEHAIDKGHNVLGLTISEEQYRYSKNRLNEKANIMLQDYRKVKGKFDAIVSIEMFEAVGKQYWSQYFSALKSNLANDGVAMVQTITIKDEEFESYSKRSDYIRHYVFPGGFLPSISQFKNSAEKVGLVCKDIFSFGQDYAKTLREWLVRFDENEPFIRELGYNDSFIRSWRLYMSICAASFACERTNVIQVELAHA